MGVLKDAVHTAVMQHLRTMRNHQTLILSLNAPNGIGPATIRTAWSTLKENGKDEGIKKATGLQAVLKERTDIFTFHTNEKGHNLITLTPNAVAMDPASPLPPKGPAYNPPPSQAPAASGATSDALLVQAMMAADELQAAELKTPGLIAATASAQASLEPAKKKQKTTSSTYSAPLKGQGKSKFGYYTDIVWTPELAAHNELVKSKDAQFARALYNACEIHGGQRVTISQIGANFEVNSLKKDPQFRNHKLIDILRSHEKVFDLVADSGIGGFVVNLQPGAGAALPDAETFFNEMTEEELMLPTRIEEPRSQAQRMQALRIELCHVLYKRGKKAQLNELGQDQKVQKVKTGLPKTLKLIEFIRGFPGNFTVTNRTDGLMDVELNSADCSDQSMIERSIEKTRQATERFREKGLGKGRGGGGGGGGRDFGGSSQRSMHDAQALLENSPQQQYLNALAQQSIAAAYGAYGQPAVGQGFSAAPAHGQPGAAGFGFSNAGHLI